MTLEIDDQNKSKRSIGEVWGKDKETRRHTTVASGDSETEMPRTPWDGKKEIKRKQGKKMTTIKIGDMWNQDNSTKGNHIYEPLLAHHSRSS
jgi:hypothetical protein